MLQKQTGKTEIPGTERRDRILPLTPSFSCIQQIIKKTYYENNQWWKQTKGLNEWNKGNAINSRWDLLG